MTKSGTFKRHDNYLEFTINVNMWAFLAKKGLHTLIPTFPEFVFNIGFTIEARKDEEMPGRCFSCSSFCICHACLAILIQIYLRVALYCNRGASGWLQAVQFGHREGSG